MQIKIFIIFSVLVFTLTGCTPMIEYSFYKNLDPWSREFDDASETAIAFLENAENRKEAINKVEEALDHSFLNYKDQIRLSILTIGIFRYSDSSEYEKISWVVKKGKKHLDFLGFFLFGTESIMPPFIEISIEALREYKGKSFKVPGHDGQKKKKYFAIEIAHNLEKATGKKYGENWEKWQEWWETEGKNLEFDWENEVYIPTTESLTQKELNFPVQETD